MIMAIFSPNTMDLSLRYKNYYQEYSESKDLADIVLKVNGETIYAHKIILLGKSEYFKTLVETNVETTKEKVDGLDTYRVDLPESISIETFRIVLAVMYGINCIVTMENLKEVYQTADFLKMSGITNLIHETYSGGLSDKISYKESLDVIDAEISTKLTKITTDYLRGLHVPMKSTARWGSGATTNTFSSFGVSDSGGFRCAASLFGSPSDFPSK